MVTYADSSFLVSIYIEDSCTAKARAYFAKSPEPILLTRFSKSETQHAMRMRAFQKSITVTELTRALFQFEHDEAEGFYQFHPFQTENLFQKSLQLSQSHALEHGIRYLDLLHVASAQLADAKRFLTFDVRQGRLARAVGLQVKP